MYIVYPDQTYGIGFLCHVMPYRAVKRIESLKMAHMIDDTFKVTISKYQCIWHADMTGHGIEIPCHTIERDIINIT